MVQRLVIGEPYRMRRILAFIDPWADPQGIGYQVIQSRIAIGSGSLTGLGLGAGLQKEGFLPGTENDFIFCVLGEELGLLGSLAVLGLFALVLWQAWTVVRRARVTLLMVLPQRGQGWPAWPCTARKSRTSTSMASPTRWRRVSMAAASSSRMAV